MKLNELISLINYNSYVCRVTLCNTEGEMIFGGKSTSDFLNGFYLECKVIGLRPNKSELDILLDIK